MTVEDEYVAWVRFKGSSIETCDSDTEGAFEVYRQSTIKKAVDAALADAREVGPCGKHPKACLVKVTATLADGSIDNTPVCEFCAELEAREEKLGDLREKIRVLAEKYKRWARADCDPANGSDILQARGRSEAAIADELLSTLDPPATITQSTGAPPAASPPSWDPPGAVKEPQWACMKCGKLRTKAEGGNAFSMCEECWDWWTRASKCYASYPGPLE